LITVEQLVAPLVDLDLRLDNTKYEKFEKDKVFIAAFTKQASKALK
jgi:hypothetical protein